MVCHPHEEHPELSKFQLFLSKFKLLDKIKWNEDLIADNIKFVCQKMTGEKISAAFMDFSVGKYRHIGWSLAEAIEFICDRFDEYSTIPIIPILSIKYESPEEAQFKISNIINNPKVGNRICGIDYVGDESKFNPHIQGKICEMWEDRFVRLHVGESGPIDNIKEALKFKNVTNIAHGIKIVECNDLMKKVSDTNIAFDVAPTSNYLTGVTAFNTIHPAVKMIDNKIQVTVGSDDPIQCNTTLPEEIVELLHHGLEPRDVYEITENSIRQFKRWEVFKLGPEQNFDLTNQYNILCSKKAKWIIGQNGY